MEMNLRDKLFLLVVVPGIFLFIICFGTLSFDYISERLENAMIVQHHESALLASMIGEHGIDTQQAHNQLRRGIELSGDILHLCIYQNGQPLIAVDHEEQDKSLCPDFNMITTIEQNKPTVWRDYLVDQMSLHRADRNDIHPSEFGFNNGSLSHMMPFHINNETFWLYTENNFWRLEKLLQQAFFQTVLIIMMALLVITLALVLVVRPLVPTLLSMVANTSLRSGTAIISDADVQEYDAAISRLAA